MQSPSVMLTESEVHYKVQISQIVPRITTSLELLGESVIHVAAIMGEGQIEPGIPVQGVRRTDEHRIV